MRGRSAIRIRTVFSLAALVIAAACSGSGPDDDAPAPAEVELLDHRALYPGAGFRIPIDIGANAVGEADRGDVVRSRDGSALVYAAPVEVTEDRYRILERKDGPVVARGQVTTTMPPPASLEVLEIEPGRHISARYGPVEIEARLVDGIATAVYRRSAPDAQLEVRLDLGELPQEGTLDWRGVVLDGYGPLSDEEAAVMDELATGPLARAITMVPLDLGCIESPFDIPGEIYAALVFPWQMILKYEIGRRDPVVRHFLDASRCSFPGHMDDPGSEPQNVAILWDADHSVPGVHAAFPFDGEGQMTPVRLER